jgi:hypothetical protein
VKRAEFRSEQAQPVERQLDYRRLARVNFK